MGKQQKKTGAQEGCYHRRCLVWLLSEKRKELIIALGVWELLSKERNLSWV
jgi:hypothetical protein